MKRLVFPLSLVLLVGLSASAAAQPAQRFEDVTQVLSVEVPVTVVGRDGHPVRGLSAESFEVLDEGVPQSIRGFDVIDLAVQGVAETGPASPDAPSLRRSSARRHFLLLFDLSFSTPTAVFKARVAARDFVLQSLHPSDLAAIATVSLEQGVRLVVTFTPDRAQLARGIDTLGLRSPGDTQAASIDPLKFMLAPPASLASAASSAASGGSRSSLGPTDREDLVLEYLNAIGQQVDRTQKMFDRARITAMTRTMGDMARNLDTVKGRKHVVLFSEGFDSRLLLGRETGTAEEETDQLDLASGRIWQVDSDNRYGNTELQNDMARMLEQFRRADCVIQAVDIGGLRARGDASGGERRSGKEALFVMADGTGGELFEDANDLRRQLDRVLTRNEVTYVLSFERDDLVADGAYHRLQVRLRPTHTTKLPPGARLAHRSGYYAPQPFKDLDPLEKSLLASDQIASAAPRRDIELEVLTAPFRAGAGRAYVPVIIEIDGRSLIQGATGDRLAVEIFGYVSDAAGEMRDFFSQIVGVDLKDQRAKFERTGVKYYGHFELQPGRHLVRVLVRNNDNGRTGVETVALDVPSYAGTQPVLLPPFFLEAPGRWLLVRERAAPDEGRSVVYPFVVNGEPFVPAAKPELRAEDAAARLCLVAYNLAAGPPELVATVRGADGRTVDGGKFELLERTATGIDGVDKLLAQFEPDDLARGEYRLEVALTDSGSGIRRSTSIPFAVQ